MLYNVTILMNDGIKFKFNKVIVTDNYAICMEDGEDDLFLHLKEIKEIKGEN